MSRDSRMPEELRDEWMKEEERHLRAFAACVARWPNFRLHMAYAHLGAAIANVDSFGGDVEGFLRKLRAVEPKPHVLIPPEAS